jgi:hypothetical protein
MGLFLVVFGSFVQQVEAADSKVAFALTTRPDKCTFSLMNTQGKTVQSGASPFIGKVPIGRYRLVVQCPAHLKEARVLNIQKATVLMVAPFPVPRGRTPARAPVPRRSLPRRTVTPRKATPPRTTVRKAGTTSAPTVRKAAPKKRAAPLRFAPPVRKSATPALSSKPSKATKTLKRKRPIPWIPIVTGGALLIAGGVFFILSQNSLSYADNKNNFQLMAYREYLTARDHRSTAFFLLIAGGVAMAISGVMYFWGWPSKRKGRKFYDPPRAQMQGLFPTVGLSTPPALRRP